ncbi:hypothetical protein V1502_19195 [Bacillus sp. SCS-153A]|uniref:hypothetical protein n=1 Tax=Rossellomorea sedimentorum TaxID=3115294 RepID=UPI003905E2A6
MKKKFSLVVFFTVLFLAVGAFHYQGTKSTVTATDSNENTKESQVEETSHNNEEEETTEDGQETDTEENSDTDSSTDGSAAEESKNTSSIDTESEDENTTNNENSSKDQETPPQEKIQFGNTEYVDISSIEKFKDLTAFAHKHGAKPFAIENSDCFAIFKEGEPLLFFSVGTVSAGVEDISILKDFFTDYHNFSEEKRIARNIELVAETGAKVQVDFPDGSGYHIVKEENTVLVNWG